MISGRTRIACVIGDPVAHSLSPAMHNAAFRHLGLDYIYVPFHVQPPQLKAAVAGMRALQIVGMNVTIPHKEKILGLLDSISETATSVGAVNTVVNRGGRLHGENTDVHGFRQAMAEVGVELRGKRLVVIGAGGAARSVLVALAEENVAEVRLFNRTQNRGRRLAQLFGTEVGNSKDSGNTRQRARQTEGRRASRLGRKAMVVIASPLDQLGDADLHNVDVVVNTTSIGLGGESFPPMRHSSAARSTVFFDLVPKLGTAFQQAAKSARRRTLDGTSMLLHQGAAAFELWTGQPAPLEVMRKALRSAI